MGGLGNVSMSSQSLASHDLPLCTQRAERLIVCSVFSSPTTMLLIAPQYSFLDCYHFFQETLYYLNYVQIRPFVPCFLVVPIVPTIVSDGWKVTKVQSSKLTCSLRSIAGFLSVILPSVIITCHTPTRR